MARDATFGVRLNLEEAADDETGVDPAGASLDVARSKPHPDGYLAAASRLGVTPSACVVIEDAPAGIESARAAGMHVIGITTTFPRERLACDICVDDLRVVTVLAI